MSTAMYTNMSSLHQHQAKNIPRLTAGGAHRLRICFVLVHIAFAAGNHEMTHDQVQNAWMCHDQDEGPQVTFKCGT